MMQGVASLSTESGRVNEWRLWSISFASFQLSSLSRSFHAYGCLHLFLVVDFSHLVLLILGRVKVFDRDLFVQAFISVLGHQVIHFLQSLAARHIPILAIICGLLNLLASIPSCTAWLETINLHSWLRTLSLPFRGCYGFLLLEFLADPILLDLFHVHILELDIIS